MRQAFVVDYSGHVATGFGSPSPGGVVQRVKRWTAFCDSELHLSVGRRVDARQHVIDHRQLAFFQLRLVPLSRLALCH